MPKRTDIKSIMVIGAGPIVIGQACEFDYSGTQACKALKEEGYRVILVNSNPATIMTDPGVADRTYVEPVNAETAEKIIAAELPDALLPTVGGQTALNCALELHAKGVLEKYGVTMIGALPDAIDKAENRRRFNDAMAAIGLETPRNAVVHSLEEGLAELPRIGLPAIIRPSFTLGGSGGGIASTEEEFREIVASGLDASPTREVLVDESILGWKEYEMEVVRDKNDNAIIICSIENVDPMGVHTGDSITVAPALTLTDKEYQRMRNASIAVLREIGVETGGSNVQFAVNPKDGRLAVIEMNPRVSRSSALASKATGFPIAKVAAKLAVGYTLDEIANDVTRVTPASFEPAIDYVVVKIPRFTFEKFRRARPLLSSAMRSVGEAMAIGRSFAEALQKGLRSMETGLTGLNPPKRVPSTKDALLATLKELSPDRLLRAAHALRIGATEEEVCAATQYDPWFVEQLAALVAAEGEIAKNGLPEDKDGLLRLKMLGFSDMRLAELSGKKERDVRALRHRLGVRPVYKTVDTCAAEFASFTPYMYSCYENGFAGAQAECESNPTGKTKIIILGGGPNRIGQGIEFDYACVHAAKALSAAGYETIMINCNPETVSTDYDTSDRLYFEPLSAEDVIEVARTEQENGTLLGVIVQFGGQTPLKLSKALEEEGIPIIGTSPDKIDLAEDRDRFRSLLLSIGLRQPQNVICATIEQVESEAAKLGLPVVVRPSNVLGGRAMEIVHTEEKLRGYLERHRDVLTDGPILLDKFLDDSIEVDVDVLSDGIDVRIAGIMEHIEEAGVHSGDSACVLPPYSLSPDMVAEITESSIKLAKALDVVGLMNVQYAVKNNALYVLEANPRASRTVPFVAKATGLPVAKIAALIMAGAKLKELSLPDPATGHYAVKEAVFPFARFENTDILLGPEMQSTGEVMGVDANLNLAFAKAQIAAGSTIPLSGNVLFSVTDKDKPAAFNLALKLKDVGGFTLMATGGTAQYFRDHGLTETQEVNKIIHGGDDHAQAIIEAGKVRLLINTDADSTGDAAKIRRSAYMRKTPYTTTIPAARAMVNAIAEYRAGNVPGVMALQDIGR
ncbi:MAG: carbamoyl-phosphate synthase large subunit [Rickettsiales bacterium]